MFGIITVEHGIMKDGICYADRKKMYFLRWKSAEKYMRQKCGNLALACSVNGYTTYNCSECGNYEFFYTRGPKKKKGG